MSEDRPAAGSTPDDRARRPGDKSNPPSASPSSSPWPRYRSGPTRPGLPSREAARAVDGAPRSRWTSREPGEGGRAGSAGRDRPGGVAGSRRYPADTSYPANKGAGPQQRPVEEQRTRSRTGGGDWRAKPDASSNRPPGDRSYRAGPVPRQEQGTAGRSVGRPKGARQDDPRSRDGKQPDRPGARRYEQADRPREGGLARRDPAGGRASGGARPGGAPSPRAGEPSRREGDRRYRREEDRRHVPQGDPRHARTQSPPQPDSPQPGRPRREDRASDRKRPAGPREPNRNQAPGAPRYPADDRGGAGRRGDRLPRGPADRGDRRRDQRPGDRSPRRDGDVPPQGPAVPDHVTGAGLPREVQVELATLPSGRAELVARHLEMAGRLLDTDPDQAYRHAQAALHAAPRLPAVREAAGLSAYLSGRYDEALAELRAARRLSGSEHYLPLIADAERGLGRPDRALAVAASPEARGLDRAGQIEMRIVAAGARRDLDQPEAAALILQVPELSSTRVSPEVARLRYAYADALLAAGRREEALEWFARATEADPEGETGADERVAELSGVTFVDLEEDATPPGVLVQQREAGEDDGQQKAEAPSPPVDAGPASQLVDDAVSDADSDASDEDDGLPVPGLLFSDAGAVGPGALAPGPPESQDPRPAAEDGDPPAR